MVEDIKLHFGRAMGAILNARQRASKGSKAGKHENGRGTGEVSGDLLTQSSTHVYPFTIGYLWCDYMFRGVMMHLKKRLQRTSR